MARLNLKGILAMVLLLCQLALPFPTHPLQAEEIPPDSNGVKAAPVVAPEQEGAKGIASYYAKRYNGRKTCSGVRYDPEKLTAAHPDLPFGTRVKVINLANDREVIVTVNDRCQGPELSLYRPVPGRGKKARLSRQGHGEGRDHAPRRRRFLIHNATCERNLR